MSLRVIAAALIALLLTGLAAHAAEDIVVKPGSSTVIARATKPITGQSAERGKVAVVEEVGTEPYVLIYVAPPTAGQIEDKVSYTVDGRQATKQIKIGPDTPTLADSAHYDASFRALFALFILAVLVECGLALLFNWKPFVQAFDTRAVNALVAFAFSLLLVRLFDLDIATKLINTYSGSSLPGNWPGMLLTAMIIAGGSAGVNRLFRIFGFRAPGAEPEAAPQPNLTEAWISVTPIRKDAVGKIDVLIGPPNTPTVAGSVSADAARPSPVRWLFRDKARFPPSGGHTVTAGADIVVQLRGHDAKGNPVMSGTWGPYKIGPRAIVDIELKI